MNANILCNPSRRLVTIILSIVFWQTMIVRCNKYGVVCQLVSGFQTDEPQPAHLISVTWPCHIATSCGIPYLSEDQCYFVIQPNRAHNGGFC